MDVTISMPMGGGQLRADSINVPAKPTGVAEPRSRFRRKCAIGAAVVVTVLGAVFGAMYINVLNNLPQFIDEAGNSTIELLFGVQDTSIAMNMTGSALPSSMWHTYDLHKADCTMEVSSKNMKGPMQLVDFTIKFEDFHVEPASPATVEVTASIAPSKAWPAEQAQYGLDPRIGVADAVRTVADGAPLSGAARCSLDVSAKLFNSIDTGVMNLQHTFKLGGVDALGGVEALFAKTEGGESYISQEVFDAVNFQNVTAGLLSGNAIEAALAAPIELFLNEHPLSTTALKEFGVRVEPVEMSVGVSKSPLPGAGAAPPARLAHWNIDVGALHLDLQNSKCIESGTTVALRAGTLSNGTKSSSVLTPAARAFSELASAGSASFPLVFKNHQLWFEFLFGKNHVATAQFTSTHENVNSTAASSSLQKGGPGVRQRRDLLAFGGGLVDALEEASCYSSCEIANDDDTNDSFFGATCTGGDGSSALKTCCAKCDDDYFSMDWFTECDVKDAGAPEESCFEIRADDSTAIQMCATQGACKIGVSAHAKVETFPVHLTGAATIDFADTENIKFDATGRDGKGPYTAAISGVATYDSNADSVGLELQGNVEGEDSVTLSLDAVAAYDSDADSYGLELQGSVEDEEGVTFSLDAKPSLDLQSSSFKMPTATFHDGNDEWETDVAVQCGGRQIGMGLGRQRRDLLALGLLEDLDALEQAACYSSCEIANDDDGSNDSIFGASCSGGDGSSALKACCAKCNDETNVCTGELNVFKEVTIDGSPRSVREMKVVLERAAVDFAGDSGGVELQMEGTRQGDPMSWMSAVTWKSGPDSYDANVDIELSSAGGQSFVFKTGQAQYLHETSLLSLDATIKQANSADVGINLGMRCDNVAGSMYPEQVVADGVTRSKGGDNSQDTKFCTGSVELMEGSSTSYSLNVEKAAFDVEGDGGGFELASHGTIFGDYVELDLLIGWNALYEILSVRFMDYGSEEWFEQPQYDMSSYMPNWQRDSMQSVDLFHTLKFVSRSGEKFELSTQPTINLLSGGFNADVPATLELEGEQYKVDASINCAEVNSPTIGDGSEYGCKNIDLSVKSDGKVRVSADLGKVVINVGADGAVAIEGEVLADDQMHSVSTDIQWIDNDNAGTFEVKRMHASVTQVPDLSQRTRRASANVFVMDGDMFIDLETDGITDFLNKMEMSMSMEMETSATKRVSLAFGDKSFEPTEETIAVVDMDSTSEYTAGQTTLKVPDVSNVRVGDYLFIGKGASQQKVRVTAVSRADGTVTLETELKDTHEIGTKLSFQSGSFGDVAPISKSSASSTYCSAIFALAAVVTATMV